jgi:hypothetical protein
MGGNIEGSTDQLSRSNFENTQLEHQKLSSFFVVKAHFYGSVLGESELL